LYIFKISVPYFLVWPSGYLEPSQWQDIPGKTCQIFTGDGNEYGIKVPYLNEEDREWLTFEKLSKILPEV